MNSQTLFDTIKSHIRTRDDIEDRLVVLTALEQAARKLELAFEATEARELIDSLRQCDERQLRYLYGREAR
jgi:hypothetical protein